MSKLPICFDITDSREYRAKVIEKYHACIRKAHRFKDHGTMSELIQYLEDLIEEDKEYTEMEDNSEREEKLRVKRYIKKYGV